METSLVKTSATQQSGLNNDGFASIIVNGKRKYIATRDEAADRKDPANESIPGNIGTGKQIKINIYHFGPFAVPASIDFRPVTLAAFSTVLDEGAVTFSGGDFYFPFPPPSWCLVGFNTVSQCDSIARFETNVRVVSPSLGWEWPYADSMPRAAPINTYTAANSRESYSYWSLIRPYDYVGGFQFTGWYKTYPGAAAGQIMSQTYIISFY